MNTKATAAATKEGTNNTAKEGNTNMTKQAANEGFTPITEAEDKEYTDLHNKHLDLNDAQEARYLELAKKIRAAKSQKAEFVKGIKSKLTNAAVAIKEIFGAEDIKANFAITDIFTQEEINAAATSAKGGKTQAQGTATPRTPKVFASEGNPVFIKIPRANTDHKKTADVVIKQGRANEHYQGKQIFGSVGIPLLRCKGNTVAETEKNIKEYIVDEEFGKSQAGKDELQKIAAAVFAFVPPKAKT